MAPRKKIIQPELPSASNLADHPAERERCLVPRVVQYVPLGETETWHCENFAALLAEYLLQGRTLEELAIQMQRVHAFVSLHPRQWLFVRRLYGVAPLLPDGANPDDLRVLTREQLCQQHGLTLEQLEDELAVIRAAWTARMAQAQRQPVEAESPVSDEKETSLDGSLLERFGFPPQFFEVPEFRQVPNPAGAGQVWAPRSKDENEAERQWMLRKLGTPSWQKMLADPRAGEMARSALLNELQARRLQSEMSGMWPSNPRYKSLQELRAKTEAEYRNQYNELEDKFPELATAGRVTFRGTVSDLNLAHRQYYGRNDRRLWDLLFNAQELELLTRQSLQAPDARYRLGWQVFVTEAMHGLYDPNFRSQLPLSVLRKLDLGFKRGVEEARRENNEPLVDLENSVSPGEGDDFPDYKID